MKYFFPTLLIIYEFIVWIIETYKVIEVRFKIICIYLIGLTESIYCELKDMLPLIPLNDPQTCHSHTKQV